ncbi:MAG: adenosylcobinamide-phosphate synthase CbiB [Candidatus Rokuibacteriota bacterium]
MSVLLLALLLDLLVGDPSNRFHPVAWTGRLLAWGREVARTSRPSWLMLSGGGVLVGVLALVGSLAAAASWGAGVIGWPGLLLEAALLKCAFSVRSLVSAATGVATALEIGSLEEARRRVGWHLVSRPTEALSAPHVASATVESLAENLTDSVVAPLFFFLLGGLPAAWAYRVVNTADAMWGYREGELEYFGKAAARLDDVLNWIPARVAALGIVLGALVVRQAPGNAWKTMWSDHDRTVSPNAGWTMAAMAGALGVTLEKPGAYRLGAGPLATVRHIYQAVWVMIGASALAVAASLALAAVRS